MRTARWQGPRAPASITAVDPDGVSRPIFQPELAPPDWDDSDRASLVLRLGEDAEERRDLALDMLELVGMAARSDRQIPASVFRRATPAHCRRACLAGAARFLICDEPTSALDVSIQAEILNLLKDLQAQFGLTILFISHNLAVVRQMADDTAVLRNGKLEEVGATEPLFAQPQAEYTQKLLSLTPAMPKEWQ